MGKTNELKPCPFCGGEAEGDAGFCTEYYGHEHQDCWVVCKNCGAEVSVSASGPKGDFPCSCCHNTMEAAYRKWNRRVEGVAC